MSGCTSPFWVQNHAWAELWSGPDEAAISFGYVELFSYLQVLEPPRGPRLHVLNPLTAGTGWIDAVAVGPSGEPPEAYVRPPAPVAGLDLPGRVVGGVNLRSARRRPLPPRLAPRGPAYHVTHSDDSSSRAARPPSTWLARRIHGRAPTRE